jgi:hypothetical protein
MLGMTDEYVSLVSGAGLFVAELQLDIFRLSLFKPTTERFIKCTYNSMFGAVQQLRSSCHLGMMQTALSKKMHGHLKKKREILDFHKPRLVVYKKSVCQSLVDGTLGQPFSRLSD